MTEQEKQRYAELHGITDGELARMKLLAMEAAEAAVTKYDAACEKASPRKACKAAMEEIANKVLAGNPAFQSMREAYLKMLGAAAVVSLVCSACLSIGLFLAGKYL
ncbi:MAG: hypothetical protein WC464_05700 [Bdellovibrionales bacterium]